MKDKDLGSLRGEMALPRGLPEARWIKSLDESGTEKPLVVSQGVADAVSHRAVHYIGFRDDRYLNAYRVFGGPRFIHRTWDARARREIGENDVVVFATGDEHQPLARFNSVDLDESVFGTHPP